MTPTPMQDETDALEEAAPAEPERHARGAIVWPEIIGVPVEQVSKLLGSVWRDSTQRGETPTLLQLLHQGVERVDVDATSGYVAVTAVAETHRAIGVRRDLVAPLVAALTQRSTAEVQRMLAKGPARIESSKPTP